MLLYSCLEHSFSEFLPSFLSSFAENTLQSNLAYGGIFNIISLGFAILVYKDRIARQILFF